MFHCIKHDVSVREEMIIKLDMKKADDRVEWPFLEGVMIKLGVGELG